LWLCSAKGYGMADPEYLPYDPNTDKNNKDESGKPFTCKSGREYTLQQQGAMLPPV
jgi:hypothetical protein